MKSWLLGALTLVLMSCSGGDDMIVVVPQPPVEECVLDGSTQRFEVYFVVDVSGSMEPFLGDLSLALRDFASSFPDRDQQDRRILVNYYVVAFVNDVAWFPSEFARRMSSPISVQSAIAEAVEVASNDRLLTKPNTVNAEVPENALDALAIVLDDVDPEDNERVLVLFATDATFPNEGERLSGDITVQTSYETLRQAYLDRNIRLHAFVPGELDGITRNYRGMERLTTGPGSETYDLRELSESDGLIERTLNEIAANASCRPEEEPEGNP